jgi:hypothetical protein
MIWRLTEGDHGRDGNEDGQRVGLVAGYDIRKLQKVGRSGERSAYLAIRDKHKICYKNLEKSHIARKEWHVQLDD